MAGCQSRCAHPVQRSPQHLRLPEADSSIESGGEQSAAVGYEAAMADSERSANMSRSRQNRTQSRPSSERSSAPPSGPPATAGLLHL
jgi:hypothetical protein